METKQPRTQRTMQHCLQSLPTLARTVPDVTPIRSQKQHPKQYLKLSLSNSRNSAWNSVRNYLQSHPRSSQIVPKAGPEQSLGQSPTPRIAAPENARRAQSGPNAGPSCIFRSSVHSVPSPQRCRVRESTAVSYRNSPLPVPITVTHPKTVPIKVPKNSQITKQSPKQFPSSPRTVPRVIFCHSGPTQ